MAVLTQYKDFMDRQLLEQAEPGPQLSRETEAATSNNSEDEIVAEQPQYREAEIEPRKPPFRLTFKPPFKFDGQEYKELIFDFDSMTGKDFIRAERTFSKLYKADKNEIAMPELKHLYHNIICANLAGVNFHLIQNLERRYYVALRTEALKSCGSSPEEEKA